MHDHIARVLITEAEIEVGISRVAGELTDRFGGRDLTLVAILKGSFVFVADLIRRLPVPLRVAFVWAESYREGTAPGALDLFWTAREDEIAGRSVLVVDDILDSGRTLAAVRRECFARGAAEVHTCVFLDKPERRAVEFIPDFACFEIEDVFVVGYGLDHAGRYRNLPYVAALKPEFLASSAVAPRGARP